MKFPLLSLFSVLIIFAFSGCSTQRSYQASVSTDIIENIQELRISDRVIVTYKTGEIQKFKVIRISDTALIGKMISSDHKNSNKKTVTTVEAKFDNISNIETVKPKRGIYVVVVALLLSLL